MLVDERLIPVGIDDERSRALLSLVERLEGIDRLLLLLYRIDSAPAAVLYPLAWQLSVTGVSGWDLADTDAKRRDLLKRAIELHRKKGTPWAIKEALRAVGWPAATIDEHFGGARYDGTFQHNAAITYSYGTSWARFAVIVGELADGFALTAELTTLIESIIATWQNARSHLIEVAFTSALSDEIPPVAEEPMPIFLTTYHRYNGVYQYDAEIDHTGYDTVELEAA